MNWNTLRIPVAALLLSALALPAHAAERAATAPSPQPISIAAERPAFPDAPPRAINEKAIREVSLRVADAYAAPRVAPIPPDTPILGTAVATEEQMAAFITRRNPKPKLNASVAELVHFYYEEGAREGIRGDIALCQALKETGFFTYGGDVSPAQNNFCGLGATGNHEPGALFATPALGVRAHIQHLKAYATSEPPVTPLVDPRYTHVKQYRPDVFGKIATWRGLNGVWAVPGKEYGEQILALWQEATRPDASERSLAAAEERVHRAPESMDAYLYRGSVHYYRGDYARALADFQKAAGGKTVSTDTLFDRALAEEKAGNTARAQKTYARLLKEAPSDAGARYNRARLLLAAKKYDDALRELSPLLKDNPKEANAENLLAVASIGKKDYQGAWLALAKAAELSPSNMDILANQFILEACLIRP